MNKFLTVILAGVLSLSLGTAAFAAEATKAAPAKTVKAHQHKHTKKAHQHKHAEKVHVATPAAK